MDVHPLGGILRRFEAVPDPRRQNVTYTLPQLLTLTLMGVLCGCDDYESIADWVELRLEWLADLLGLPENRSPSSSTFERLLRRLDPAALQSCFIEITQALACQSEGRLVAIDGKSLRGSFDDAHRTLPIHLVHAWDHANGLMLGQVAVAEKSNEITAVPALLKLLDIENAVVSLDALHCQTATAQAIRDGGGDYLLAVKDNQKRLAEDLKLFFDDAITMEDPGVTRWCDEPDNSHGRLDERTTWAAAEVGWLRKRQPHWPDLNGVVCVEARRLDFATSKTQVHRRVYITSLDPRTVGAERLGRLVRGHWSVENNLHWCLDVSFGDDGCRVRKDHGPENLAVAKRVTLGLLKHSTPEASTPGKAARMSVKRRRMRCMQDDAYLIQTMTVGV